MCSAFLPRPLHFKHSASLQVSQCQKVPDRDNAYSYELPRLYLTDVLGTKVPGSAANCGGGELPQQLGRGAQGVRGGGGPAGRGFEFVTEFVFVF